jgi:hypothetical protein
VSGAGRSFSTWDHSPSSETAAYWWEHFRVKVRRLKLPAVERQLDVIEPLIAECWRTRPNGHDRRIHPITQRRPGTPHGTHQALAGAARASTNTPGSTGC